MIVELLIKVLIKIMELYSRWTPDWQWADGAITALTYVIYYSKIIGIWINTSAFYGSMLFIAETLVFVAILKGILFFIGFVRGAKLDY